jgi:hypothetical protein
MRLPCIRHASQLTRFSALLALSVTLCACSHLPLKQPSEDVAQFPSTLRLGDAVPAAPERYRGRGTLGSSDAVPSEIHDLAYANALNASYYWKVERGGIRTAPAVDRPAAGVHDGLAPATSDLPAACVAFSGGGIRSAAVAAGALSALGSSRSLQDISYISATSGGAYASAWLYSVAYGTDSDLNHIFDNTDIPFPYLELDASGGFRPSTPPARDLVGLRIVQNAYLNRVLAGSDFISDSLVAAGVATLPLGIATAATLRTITPGTPIGGALGIVYGTAIRSTFLQKQRISLAALGPLATKYRFPFPIFVGSVSEGRLRPCGNPTFGDSLDHLIEISPTRIGNHSIGFSDQFQSEQLHSIIATVGAAPDDPRMESWCRFSESLSVDVGMRIGNFAARPSTPHVDAEHACPGSPGIACYSDGIHIADGGFVDNLALTPLVERLCKTIIVLDAEHDPLLEFAAYRKIKQLLRSQRGIDLRVDAIDRHLDALLNGVGTSPIINATTLRPHFRADLLVNNGFAGSVEPIPFYDKETNNVQTLKLRVIYFKLGFDGTQYRSLPIAASLTYAKDFHDPRFADPRSGPHCVSNGFLSERCPFPQESTQRQSFTSFEFWAYASLGAHLVRDVHMQRP